MAFDLQTFAWSVATAGGGGAVVTYGAFKVLATKWLDNHMAARLQELKHSHDREMAALKCIIDERHDRAVKLTQREFEVVPDIWRNATEAHHAVLRLISIGQEGIDVGNMAEPQFEAWLAGSRLQDWQKEEIKTKSRFGRTSYYSGASR